MSIFDEELITDLNTRNINFDILTDAEHASLVRAMNERIPFSGSKVDWGNLKNGIDFEHESSNSAISRLAEEMRKIDDGNVIFVGDSACDEAYSISLIHIDKALEIFSKIPQHTYIVPGSLTWIACISFEGDLDLASLL